MCAENNHHDLQHLIGHDAVISKYPNLCDVACDHDSIDCLKMIIKEYTTPRWFLGRLINRCVENGSKECFRYLRWGENQLVLVSAQITDMSFIVDTVMLSNIGTLSLDDCGVDDDAVGVDGAAVLCCGCDC